MLSHLVKNYLLVNLDPLSGYHPVKPYPTRVEQALIFFARGHIECFDPLSGKTISIARNALFGQQVSRLDFRTIPETDFLMLAVVFQPGALHRLLGLSLQELTCQFCDAESIIASELKSVNDEIANGKNYHSMIEGVQKYLLRKLRAVKVGDHPIDRIGQLLLTSPTPFSLDWLASQANLSPRQFERKFNERIGISPKLFSRISRFFKTFEYKEQNPNVDWLTIALQFGYTDYYHLAKDFKQFAIVSPNVMIKEYANRPESLLLQNDSINQLLFN
jgi:AraC-like DNA-binding protein